MLLRADQAVLRLLNRDAANLAFDWLMPRLTHLDHFLWFKVLAAAAILWALWPGGKAGRVWVLCVLVALGASDFTATHLIKMAVDRPRPCAAAGGVGDFSDPEDRLVGQCPGSPSFPSNHASNMMALGATCWWLTRTKSGTKRIREVRYSWAELWFLVPLVIGYTRCYLGVHYPSDVLGGWVLGAVVSYLVILLVARPLLVRRSAEPAKQNS